MTDVIDEAATAAPAKARDSQQGAFIWYELMTTDADGAKSFYDAVTGWTVDAESHFPNGYRMIGRSDGKSAGGLLPLTDEMTGHGARPMWLGYLSVDGVDATVAAIEGDGGKALMPAFDIPNIGRVALVADPSGAAFYIMKPIPPAGQPDAVSDVFDPMKAEHVRWNELATSDQDGSIAFYKRHFGWSQEGGMPMGEMGDYKFIQQGGVGIGAMMRRPPQLPVSLWTYYIGVADIDRASKAVTDGGGTILHGPMEIPGGEFSLNALDPQGASFGLVGPRK
jgi:predicted enzyme related to lactoylglutathione lyase